MGWETSIRVGILPAIQVDILQVIRVDIILQATRKGTRGDILQAIRVDIPAPLTLAVPIGPERAPHPKLTKSVPASRLRAS